MMERSEAIDCLTLGFERRSRKFSAENFARVKANLLALTGELAKPLAERKIRPGFCEAKLASPSPPTGGREARPNLPGAF